MSTPVIYSADPVTGEFIGTAFADPDPLNPGNWLLPAHAYFDVPPTAPIGMAVVRAGAAWELIHDHRGTVYSTQTGLACEWDSLGTLPENLTDQPRPSADYIWDGEAWVVDLGLKAANLAIARKAMQAQVDAERDRRIDAGVEFQGLRFQSRATDRENIAGAAQLGFMAMVAGAQPGDLRWSSSGQDFSWIATDNSLVPMDAQTVVAFGKAAAERKQALIFAARQLKDMQSIPADLSDDKWWP